MHQGLWHSISGGQPRFVGLVCAAASHQDVLESKDTIFFAVSQTELPLEQLMWQTRVCAQTPHNMESITMSDFIMSMAVLARLLPLRVLRSPGAEHLVIFDTFRDQTTALARAPNFRVRIP